MVRAVKVRLRLPAGQEEGFRDSLVKLAGFDVDDEPSHWVAVEPAEGAGVVARYFSPFRLADAATDLSKPATWAPVHDHPPWSEKPQIHLTPLLQRRLDALYRRTDIDAVVLRLATAAVRADAATLPSILSAELPKLFARYPRGSLWYVSVDHRLLARLSAMRIRFQLSLTPDVDYDPDARDAVQYFGMHTTTGGLNFASTLDHVMLAVSPTALGFTMGVLPHSFAFLYGEFEDLRSHEGGTIGARFIGNSSTPRGVPGIKFPVEDLPAAHLETLLAWWTTRLNVVYSHAADPTHFASDGVHDVASQVAWFFTLERMMADARVLLAAVDAPRILRTQAAFDLLDKADSLLTHGTSHEGKSFKRLLRRAEALPRLTGAFDGLPVQLRPRFQRWATESYDRLYADIEQTTMTSRRRPNGVMVARSDPAKLRLMSWDDYVATLMRTARNSSHGLQSILRPPATAKAGRDDPRLLLATNSGEVPQSFYEVAAVAFFGLMADAERLCAQTWWR